MFGCLLCGLLWFRLRLLYLYGFVFGWFCCGVGCGSSVWLVYCVSLWFGFCFWVCLLVVLLGGKCCGVVVGVFLGYVYCVGW